MLLPIPIPDPDPIPLPAPVGLLKLLLILTFILHILAMNLALGGGIIVAATHWRGQRRQSEHHLRLASELATRLPVALALTITLGVAPLLFVQVLYGQFFYTSSILLGYVWLSLLLILLVGYYGYYWYAFRWEKLGARPDGHTARLRRASARAPWVITGSALLLAVIPALFANNITLMLQPGRWWELYRTSSHWNWRDPSLLPRYLHFLLAAIAVAGLGVLLHGLGQRRRAPEYARWVMRYAGWWFIAATVIQYGVGVWFLLSLPQTIWPLFLGRQATATAVLLAGVLLSLVAIVFVRAAFTAAQPARLAGAAIVALAGTVSLMAVVRDIVRDAYLAPHFRPQELRVAPQWGIVIFFGLVLLVGLGVVAYMLRLWRRGQTPARLGGGETRA